MALTVDPDRLIVLFGTSTKTPFEYFGAAFGCSRPDRPFGRYEAYLPQAEAGLGDFARSPQRSGDGIES